jgi:transposase InsO family protein
VVDGLEIKENILSRWVREYRQYTDKPSLVVADSSQTRRKSDCFEVEKRCRVLKVSRSGYYSDRQGETVGENRVSRPICEMELMAEGKQKIRHTADSNHNLPIAQNHLSRQFKVSSPNETWVTDITYIPAGEDWL